VRFVLYKYLTLHYLAKIYGSLLESPTELKKWDWDVRGGNLEVLSLQSSIISHVIPFYLFAFEKCKKENRPFSEKNMKVNYLYFIFLQIVHVFNVIECYYSFSYFPYYLAYSIKKFVLNRYVWAEVTQQNRWQGKSYPSGIFCKYSVVV